MNPEQQEAVEDPFDMDHDTSHLPDLPDLKETKNHLLLVIVIAVVILAVGAFLMSQMVQHKTEAKKVDAVVFVPTVRVIEAEKVDFQPIISLQGEVQPATQTKLVSEVAGAVVEISPKLEVGEVFEQGELIVRVDDADYRTNLTAAMSTLADAELMLIQEKARGEQAARDWEKLGKGRKASDLVMRKPQIKSAEARIASVEATIAKAERDLAKTVVRAPYRCIVDRKYIDQGGYLNMLSPIADVYSVSDFEVRLPLSLDKVTMLPENDAIGDEVTISAQLSAKQYKWKGKVKRFEGGIDSSTFSMMMVAEVLPNDSNHLFSIPPKGMFVNAELRGEELREVVRIPLEALREGDTVWVYVSGDQNGVLAVRETEVIRRGKDFIYLRDGSIKHGDKVIVSPLAIPLEGMDLMLEKANDLPKKGEQS